MADENAEIQVDEMVEMIAATRARAADVDPSSATERLHERAEADLASVVDPNFGAPTTDSAMPFELESFDKKQQVKSEAGQFFDSLDDVELDVRIELGRTELLIEEVKKLREGSVVPLDQLAGDPVDILVNGRLVARGEVLVLNDRFCVRVAEILDPDF